MVNIATIAAIIATVTAIIAPTITALINQIGAYRLRKLELFWDEKIKVYDEFLSASCEFMYSKKDIPRIEAACNRVLLFSSGITVEKINALTASLMEFAGSGKMGNIPKENAEALTALRSEIQKYRK